MQTKIAELKAAPRWVRQEDPMGCWVAAMAMVTGKTYAQVKAETGHMARDGGHCWATDQYLAQNGFAIQRFWQHDQFKGHADGEAWRADKRDPWPLAPFAPLHVCQVQTSMSHMVVMLADGTVLDPATPEPKRLTDYAEVHKIVGVWAAHNHWPALMDVVEAARKVADYGWGASVSEAQHFERMAAMDEMRRSLEGLK